MSDQKRLEEALSRFEVVSREVIEGQEGSWIAPATLDDVLVVFKTASSLANGEQVKWCDEHRGTLLSTDRDTGEQLCWKHHMNFLPGVPYTTCRFVPRLLIDPTTEEE